MKKRHNYILLLFLGFGVLVTSPGCKTAEGCGQEEAYSVKTDKNGNLSTKRGKSSLFSKKKR